ncbi:LysR family transcriptional regulator [Thalassococcus sp. S3]|uniref:LysR family transcriptional regulator n=1 Tax=Thalassococcus sp. S3 TaxID=2017482 RepID=UPI0013EE935D|nr:LysR family transcriptional regulator [Thalassococcus sp. S3]
MPSLPSFSSLLAFDAAAQHGSFTRAAQRINVSQPAISRRVATLENDLGVKLFDRATKPMALTDAGESLFAVLRSSLSRIEAEVETLRSGGQTKDFVISAAPGFLAFWLVPRLDHLTARLPDQSFALVTTGTERSSTNSDVRVRFGTGDWPDTYSRKILNESVFPVCSAELTRKLGTEIDPVQLVNERLLQLPDRASEWYDWPLWFSAMGHQPAQPLNVLTFDSYALVIAAALSGQGIALGWAGLVEDYLKTGALVRLGDTAVTSGKGYYATCKIGQEDDPVVAQVLELLSDGSLLPS